MIRVNEMSSGRTRRKKEDIIAEILRCAVPGAPKTRIMYKASLSFKQLNGYIDYLCSEGFLAYDEHTRLYRSTGKGTAYVEKYEEYATARETARSTTQAINDILG